MGQDPVPLLLNNARAVCIAASVDRMRAHDGNPAPRVYQGIALAAVGVAYGLALIALGRMPGDGLTVHHAAELLNRERKKLSAFIR